jgi:flagellar protein FliL
MSDEMFDTDEEAGGEDQQPTAGKKKIGFLPAIVIDILKWSAIVIGAIIFIVVVVVITVRIMGQGNQATATRLPLESEYEDQSAELLDWFSEIGEIRGRTTDQVPRTFIIVPHIGYSPRNEAVLPELIQRRVRIKEAINMYFADHSINELEGNQNRTRVKRELTEQINRIMTNDVRDVAFDRYEFIEF